MYYSCVRSIAPGLVRLTYDVINRRYGGNGWWGVFLVLNRKYLCRYVLNIWLNRYDYMLTDNYYQCMFIRCLAYVLMYICIGYFVIAFTLLWNAWNPCNYWRWRCLYCTLFNYSENHSCRNSCIVVDNSWLYTIYGGAYNRNSRSSKAVPPFPSLKKPKF